MARPYSARPALATTANELMTKGLLKGSQLIAGELTPLIEDHNKKMLEQAAGMRYAPVADVLYMADNTSDQLYSLNRIAKGGEDFCDPCRGREVFSCLPGMSLALNPRLPAFKPPA